MDGNGRWAARRRRPRAAGHQAGARALRQLSDEAEKLGVEYLTVYAFSTENWARPEAEVNGLMELLRRYIQQYIEDAKKNNTRICVIGRRDRLAPDILEKIRYLENLTREKSGMCVTIALDYGSRDELARAARRLCQDVEEGRVKSAGVDEEALAARLDTAGLPDPDLLIRTGGEQRLSNFLLWQAAYSEIYVTDKCWPDFNVNDLRAAIEAFHGRERRFGGISKDSSPPPRRPRRTVRPRRKFRPRRT
jgi:undecaprenyl diphosphate synthase